jgi:hypothetical protein
MSTDYELQGWFPFDEPAKATVEHVAAVLGAPVSVDVKGKPTFRSDSLLVYSFEPKRDYDRESARAALGFDINLTLVFADYSRGEDTRMMRAVQNMVRSVLSLAAVPGLRAVLIEEVERLAARVPDLRNEFDELSTRNAWTVTGNLELATALLDAATTQLRDGNAHAATRIRVAEDAASTAAGLLDAVAEADHRSNPDESALVADAELYVASRRGAVGVKARTLRSEARRHLRLAEEAVDAKERSARLHSAAADAGRSLESAIADVTNWQASRAAHDERHGRRFDSLVLAGVLVDEAGSGELRSLLGGSSHGGGSGAPYRGIESGGTQRTAGSFGGTTTRGRHGGFSFSGSPAKMTP